MTGHCSFSRHLLASLLLIFLVVHVATLHGQTTTLPVVTIRATDGLATESGDPGLFTLFRDGPTNQTLSILLGIGGSASNGVDYESISNVAVIPAGLRTATIPIKPIQDLSALDIQGEILEFSVAEVTQTLGNRSLRQAERNTCSG